MFIGRHELLQRLDDLSVSSSLRKLFELVELLPQLLRRAWSTCASYKDLLILGSDGALFGGEQFFKKLLARPWTDKHNGYISIGLIAGEPDHLASKINDANGFPHI
jgi:hypothetical protein